jgi:hypothetical protein
MDGLCSLPDMSAGHPQPDWQKAAPVHVGTVGREMDEVKGVPRVLPRVLVIRAALIRASAAGLASIVWEDSEGSYAWP